ncbi:MAG: methyl-accepting chemotaxis protein [Gammaproteobacteria bacterium]
MRRIVLAQVTAIIVLLASLAGYAVWQFTTVARLSHQEHVIFDPLVEHLDSVELNVVDIQQFLTDASLTRSDRTLDQGRLALERVSMELTALRKLSQLLPERESIISISEHIAEDTNLQYQTGIQMMAGYQYSKDKGDVLMFGVGGFDHQTDIIRGEINKLSQIISTANRRIEQQIEEAVSAARITTLGLGLLITALTIVSNWRLFNLVVTEVGGEPASGSAVAELLAQGDLSAEIVVSNNDKSSMLAHLSVMRKRWTDVAYALRGQATNMLGAAQKLNLSASELAANMTDQSDRAAVIVTSANQLFERADAIDAQSVAATEAMREIAQFASGSSETIVAVAAEISAVAETVGRTANQVKILNDRANAIESIVGTIREISEQTNLLALNAAIEAARAGDAGRGFAVVADEVRSLAKRASNSTTSVATMVEEVRRAAGEIATTVDEGVGRVSHSVTHAKNAEEAIARVRTFAVETCQQVLEISTAMREQKRMTSDISDAITHMAANTEEVSVAARELAHVSETINTVASALDSDAAFFRLATVVEKDAVELF